MIEVILGTPDFNIIREALTHDGTESCVIGYTTLAFRREDHERHVLCDVQIPTPQDYSYRQKLEVQLSPEFVARAAKRAFRESLGLVFMHSHPGSGLPSFSVVDDAGEERLAEFLRRRVPDRTHISLVASARGLVGRLLGGREPVRVVSVGRDRTVVTEDQPGESPTTTTSPDDTFDRQVRAFGAEGQNKLQALRVAIVGLGGTGSIVAQQLVHLGVKNLILIDPDTIDTTNLNRVVGATHADVGMPKVYVAARYIETVSRSARVRAIQGDIVRQSVALELVQADIIFGCTDSHGSRAVLQQIAYQYLVPCIDLGSVIAAAGDRSTEPLKVFGRVQLLAPGFPCLTCSSVLDPVEVRYDMMNEYERKQDPYWVGVRAPAPSIVSINGVVASLAVTMLLSVVCGIPMRGRALICNLGAPTLRIVGGTAVATCFICSRTGVFGRGSSHALYARQD